MKIILNSLLFSAIFLISISSFSQDLITKKDGTDIQAKVLEVTLTEVKYKRYDNLDGPIFTVRKSELLMIRYENGTKDIFTITTPSTSGFSTKYRNCFYIAPTLPVGDFGSSSSNNNGAGYAKLGIGLAYEGIVPLGTPIVNLMMNIGFSYNPAVDNGYYSYYGYYYGGTKWGYLTNTSTLGLRFQGGTDIINFYGLAVLGVNTTFLTDHLNGYFGSSFTTGFGGGIIVLKRLNLGVRYFSSNAKFTKSNNSSSIEQKISIIQPIIGIEF